MELLAGVLIIFLSWLFLHLKTNNSWDVEKQVLIHSKLLFVLFQTTAFVLSMVCKTIAAFACHSNGTSIDGRQILHFFVISQSDNVRELASTLNVITPVHGVVVSEWALNDLFRFSSCDGDPVIPPYKFIGSDKPTSSSGLYAPKRNSPYWVARISFHISYKNLVIHLSVIFGIAIL